MDLSGYYSIIQTRHDPVRAEGLNVGVVLVVPSRNIVDVRVLTDLTAVCERLGVPQKQASAQRLLKAFAGRLRALPERSSTALWQLGMYEIEGFGLIGPRVILFPVEPIDELNALFRRCVE